MFSVGSVFSTAYKLMTGVIKMKHLMFAANHFLKSNRFQSKNRPENLFYGAVDNTNWKTFMFGGVEFPVINYEHYSGKKYDHFWGVGFGAIFQDRIYHVQFSTLQRHVWKVEGYSPSEPLFVPNQNSQAEDDGVILSLVSPFSNTLLRVSYVT